MILVALGANLPSRHGTPLQTLTAARQALQDWGARILSSSRVWMTAPVPVSDQPWFHNAVVGIETAMTPRELLSCLQEIEQDFGRVRTIRNAARLLDMDILSYSDLIIDEPGLTVPHARLQERGFVLLPLRDVAPGWIHPRTGQSLKAMIDALPPHELDSYPLPPEKDWT